MRKVDFNRYYVITNDDISGWFCVYCNDIFRPDYPTLSSYCPKCIKISRIVPMTIKEQIRFEKDMERYFSGYKHRTYSLEYMQEYWENLKLC